MLTVPLGFWPLVYRAFSLPKALLAFTLIAALVILTFARVAFFSHRSPVHSIDIWLTLFCLSLLPSIFFTDGSTSALLGSYRQLGGASSWLAMAGLAYAASVIRWDKSRLRDLANTVTITSALISMFALIQLVWPRINTIFHLELNLRPVFSTFGNAGYLGAFLAFSLPIVLIMFLGAKKASIRLAYGLVFLASFGALAGTGSRGGWIAAFSALMITLAWARHSGTRERTGRSLAFLLVLGALVFTVALYLPGSQPQPGKAERRFQSAQTFQARLYYWQAALRMTLEHPLTGTGPDTFGLMYSKYASAASQELEPETVTDDAHNLFLQLSATFGLVTMIALLALLSVSYKRFNSVLVQASDDRAPYLLGLLAGTSGYLLAVQTNINSWGTSFIPWLFVGVAASIRKRSDSSPSKITYPLLISLATILIIGVFQLASLWRADSFLARSIDEPKEEAVNSISKSVTIWPNNYSYWLALASHLAVTDPQAAAEAIGKAVEVAPLSYVPYQFQAQFYLSDGSGLPKSGELATEAAKAGLARFPNSARLQELYDSATAGE